MAQEEVFTGFSSEEDEWLASQRERDARRAKREKKRHDEGGSLNINSLMDIMVIMLVFLMKSYGDDSIKAVGQDLKVPMSSTQLNPEDMTTITVSQKAILVNDKKAVDIKDGAVDKSQKKGGETSLVIQPLLDELEQAIETKKQQQKQLGQEYKPTATIIADQGTPYRLVTEVMYTAGRAKLNQFKFAVIKKGPGS